MDDKVLWMKLFALEGEMLKDNYSSQLATKKIKETINTYLEGNGTLAMK